MKNQLKFDILGLF